MLRFFLPLSLLALSVTATAASGGSRPAEVAEVTLLNDALQKVAADYRRWAYTEHRIVRDEKGRVKSDVLLRYDPSKPYPEQWVPLKMEGKGPTERDLAKYRRKGEREAPSDAARPSAQRSSDPTRRQTLGEVLDVPRSSIASETDTHLVFEIPLLKFGNERFPPEKFHVLARLKKEGQLLENIAVRLRESFRSKLVVKVKSGDGSLDFAVVNPKYPPALVGVTGDASASVLFVSIGGSVELKRTELKHVKPFDERFEVQIGGLKAIDF